MPHALCTVLRPWLLGSPAVAGQIHLKYGYSIDAEYWWVDGATRYYVRKPGGLHAKLSGEIFVTMQSGDVKRGADVEVGLVRVADAFQAAWDGILRDYRSAFDEGLKRSEQAQARYHSLPSTSFDLGRAALEDWRQANAALGDVPGPFQQRARALIGPNLVTTVRGNADGRYHFTGVPQGRYYVIAQHHEQQRQLSHPMILTPKTAELIG